MLNLIARLSLNSQPFRDGLNSAQEAARKTGDLVSKSMVGLAAGSLGVGSIIAGTKAVIEHADAISELSERLGINAEQAQEFALAAQLGGSSSDFFAEKFEKLRAAMLEGDPLSKFGIQAKNVAEAMEKLSEKIRTTGLNAEEAGAFVDVFGKGSGKLISVLGDLQNARTNTWFINEKDIELLKQGDDAMTKLWHNVKSWSAFMISPRSGALTNIAAILGFDPFGLLKETEKSGGQQRMVQNAEAERDRATQQTKEQAREAKNLLDIQAETAKVMEATRVAQLPTEERLAELTAKRADLQHRLLHSANATEEAKVRLERAQNEAEILRVAQAMKKGEAVETVKRLSPISDSLSSVGNFLGSNPNSPQVKMLDEANRILRRIEQKLPGTTGGTMFPQ